MKRILNEPYDNQVEVDKVKAIIDDISHGLLPSGYYLTSDGRNVTCVIVSLLVKGNKDILEQDLERKTARKDELQNIVEAWMNEGTAKTAKSTADYFNEEIDRFMELRSKQTMERLKNEN